MVFVVGLSLGRLGALAGAVVVEARLVGALHPNTRTKAIIENKKIFLGFMNVRSFIGFMTSMHLPCGISFFQRLIQHRKALLQLRFGDRQRRDDQDGVPVGVYVQAMLQASLRKAAISGLEPFQGASGSFVFLSLTSSMIPNKPIERTSPTEGCVSPRSFNSRFSTGPISAACSTSLSSRMTLIFATAAASETGWEV